MTDTPNTHVGSHASTISNGVVKFFVDYAGRGPTQAKTTIAENSVMVLLHDTLTKPELRLVEHGEHKRVLDTRHKVQLMMQDDLTNLVETTLQRKVIAFMSTNHIDPDIAVEVFVLAPRRS